MRLNFAVFAAAVAFTVFCVASTPTGIHASPAMPKGYRNFPEYSRVRGYKEKCQGPIDTDSLSTAAEVIYNHLESTPGPSVTDKVFIVIAASPDDVQGPGDGQEGKAEGPLCLNRGDGKTCLLLFSSSVRSNYYGAEVLGRDEPLRVRLMSAVDVLAFLAVGREAGIASVTFDRCAACDATAILDLSSFHSAEDVLKFWRVFSSTRVALANLHMTTARALYERGELADAKTALLDLINCADVDRPDAHLLLGKCAVRLHDERLIAQVDDFLTVFSPDWRAEFEEFKRTQKAP